MMFVVFHSKEKTLSQILHLIEHNLIYYEIIILYVEASFQICPSFHHQWRYRQYMI